MPNTVIVNAAAPVVAEIVGNIPPLGAAHRSWYAVNAKANEPAEVMIYDEIGTFGISAEQFVKDFKAIDAKQINLRLNTPGGEVFGSTAIYNAIENHPANVTVHIDGLAASAGSFIAMAGDEVRMAENAYLMIHNAHGGAFGESKDMRKVADVLDSVSGNMARMYAKKTGKSGAYWRELMNQETWFTADSALENGLIDAIDAPAQEAEAKFDLNIYSNIPPAVAKRWASPKSITPRPTATLRSASDPAKPQEHLTMNLETFKAYAAEHPDAVAAYIEQGKNAEKAGAHRAEIDRMKAITAACPGKPQFAIEQFVAGSDPEAVKATASAIDAETKSLNDKLAEQAKEIDKLKALAGNVAPVAGAKVDDPGAKSMPTNLTPEAQAAWEWDNAPDIKGTSSNKDAFVAARIAEINGLHRTFIRKPEAA